MESLNNELDIKNIPTQSEIENESKEDVKENTGNDGMSENQDEQKDTTVQTNANMVLNNGDDSNNNNNNSNNYDNKNGGNSNLNNNISIFEQNQKEINYTMKTMEMMNDIKAKIYLDFKKANNMANDEKMGIGIVNTRKNEKKKQRINKYDMYNTLCKFDLDNLDLGGIHVYRHIEQRNKNNENVPSSKIGKKRHGISKLQRRMKQDGNIVANGSSDFDKNDLGSMANVSGKMHEL